MLLLTLLSFLTFICFRGYNLPVLVSLLSSIFSFPPLPPLLKCSLLHSFHCSIKDSTTGTLVGVLTSYLASKAVAFFSDQSPTLFPTSMHIIHTYSFSVSLCFTGMVLVGVQTSFLRFCIYYWQIYLSSLHYLGILAPHIFPSPTPVCFRL